MRICLSVCVQALMNRGSELRIEDSIDIRGHVRRWCVRVRFSILTLQTNYAQTLNPAEERSHT